MNSYPKEILEILKLASKEAKYSLEKLSELIGEYPINLKKNQERNKLIINSITIKGIKTNQEKIDSTFKFFSGVNVLCSNTNNLQGKTSLLKIIKFMLIGNIDSLDKFLKIVIANFKMSLEINGEEYIFEYDDKNFFIYQNELEYYSCEKKEAQKYLSKFFEEKFNYYPLNYVSNLPNSYECTERSFSWSSYFSTLYLDSKEYNTLFTTNIMGGLKNKISGILFNLEHNQFLNRIDTKQKMVSRELEKTKFLEEKIKFIREDRDSLKVSLDKLKIEFNDIIKKINDEFSYEKKEIMCLKKKYDEKVELFEEISYRLLKLRKEIMDKRKKIRYKEEEANLLKFVPINLSCPNCFKEINDKLKKEKIEKGKCYICGENHVYEEHSDVKDYTKKIKEELESILFREEKLKIEEKELKKEIKNLEKDYTQKKDEKNLKENNLEKYLEKKNELYLNITELQLKISYLEEKQKYKDSNTLKQENELLKDIVFRLKKYIYSISTSKMDIFTNKFKEEAIKIGTRNLDEILLNESYDPSFIINKQSIKFENLSPGEQLRIKIAFYLTWLKISLKENGYNHPAFLMIDSPGKEETNPRDLEELSSIFKKLDEKEEKFQIIITSAKNLLNATSKEKLKIYEGYLF